MEKNRQNNKPYISISIDKALLPLTLDEKKRLSIFPVADKENENGPDYRVVLYIPESQTQGEEKEEDLFP